MDRMSSSDYHPDAADRPTSVELSSRCSLHASQDSTELGELSHRRLDPHYVAYNSQRSLERGSTTDADAQLQVRA